MSGLTRRHFLQMGAVLGAGAMLGGCKKLTQYGLPITLYLPGAAEGHRLRDRNPLPLPSGERKAGVVILGSGVAGLFAAWRLLKSGRRDVLLVNGPEFGGNAAAGVFGEQVYPRGAHYLPLPSLEATHVRELLAEMNVIERDPFGMRPLYSEAALVHAPESRLYLDGRWQEGLMPRAGMSAAELGQQARFLALVAKLSAQHGNDGRRVFASPLALSSADPLWLALDSLNFAQWLAQEKFTAPGLLWYLDYACRDDYGAGLNEVSAWAGLHYFCSRGGRAENAEDGAVLTWPDGLNPLIRQMTKRLMPEQRMDGMAVRVKDTGRVVEVDVYDVTRNATQRIHAEHVICAMPLHVAARVVEGMHDFGFDAEAHPSAHAAWQVSNFLIDQFPKENTEQPLAWDNVVYGSNSLGFVDATHQLIRVGKPKLGVFTAYHAYAGEAPAAVRARLLNASAEDLYEVAAQDLHAVYGWRWRQYVQQVEITLRGHAMAIPSPGFLHNAGLKALRAVEGRIQFAHGDLSGLSLFEEASWWGDQAARRLL